MPKTVILSAWLGATAAWLLAMTCWRKRILARVPAGSVAWFWLRFLGIQESERNRARFLVGVSAMGIALFSAGVLALLAK